MTADNDCPALQFPLCGSYRIRSDGEGYWSSCGFQTQSLSSLGDDVGMEGAGDGAEKGCRGSLVINCSSSQVRLR